MPQYIYNLAVESALNFRTYVAPVFGVPVYYKMSRLCIVDIENSGKVEMDLEPDMIRRLDEGEAIIREFSRSCMPEPETGKDRIVFEFRVDDVGNGG